MPTAIDADTAQRLRIVFSRLARLLRATDAAGPAAELTPTRVVVLLNAVRNGPIRLAELAEQEGLNPTMLSRTVANLVEAGLVVRTADAGDRRSAWVEPTDAGRGLAEEIRRHRTKALREALSGLHQDDQLTVERALPALEHLVEQLFTEHS
ncbi:MAG TPA: MarR family transcriptional regulator [Solirubrobacteraceae bacterium]|jgi:DNA-binding MarR family transcriptional regulator